MVPGPYNAGRSKNDGRRRASVGKEEGLYLILQAPPSLNRIAWADDGAALNLPADKPGTQPQPAMRWRDGETRPHHTLNHFRKIGKASIIMAGASQISNNVRSDHLRQKYSLSYQHT